MGQPEDHQKIKEAFDSVDVNHSGYVEWDEFVYSIMGEDAVNYGALADMEMLSILLDESSQIWLQMSREISHQSYMLKEAKASRKSLGYPFVLFRDKKAQNSQKKLFGEIQRSNNCRIQSAIGMSKDIILACANLRPKRFDIQIENLVSKENTFFSRQKSLSKSVFFLNLEKKKTLERQNLIIFGPSYTL